MRFLGNKTQILQNIEDLLKEKGILKNGLTFFDAFCGSGSVAEHFKKFYNIVINDNLNWAVLYTKGRICASSCTFERLGFDPFDYLNNSDAELRGFMYNNYSPAHSSRMYFTPENAARIDYFRRQIEEWKINSQISDEEYAYLMACLVESVSFVSNTAGVYGAFLKKWDNRALKPVSFIKAAYSDETALSVTAYCEKIENIISDVDCDIIYLDPPYTQNQYGTQYHLLETLVLDDNPPISKVTGSRPTTPMRSDWSKDVKAHILLDKVIAKTKAKYIVFSYNNDGFMSKDYIEATLKRYCKAETYVCKKISYKKYQNWKSANKKEHFEYLFFIEKKPAEEVVYESPLNYIGSKAKVVPDIEKYTPDGIANYIDAFGGGFNVGINVSADKVRYNDLNCFVKGIIESLREYDTYSYIQYMRRIIKTYGLEKGNGKSYLAARNAYNSYPIEERDPRFLLTIILYGFQQQIRFNSNHDFNNPVGVRWFNDKVLEKLISFSRRIKEIDCDFSCETYSALADPYMDNAFIYLDPPYMLTTGAYNDGKRGFNGWSAEQESELFKFCDRINENGGRFMLSYVAEHKGKINLNLLSWIEDNRYNMINLGNVIGISGSRRKEVLIVNYAV